MKNRILHTVIQPQIAAAVIALSMFTHRADAALKQGVPQVPAMPATQAAPTMPGAPQQPAAPAVPAVPAEDILDIRGPIHIPAAFPWKLWSLIGAGGTLAAACLWAYFSRPKRKLPYEIALEKLEATRPLMQGESAEPFSLAVSEIVRIFIEETMPVRAAHRTTGEFLHDLVSLPDSPLSAHREPLADFLEHCDLAKFAKWSLTVPQMEAMLTSAGTFVIAIGKPEAVNSHTDPPAPAPEPEPVVISSYPSLP